MDREGRGGARTEIPVDLSNALSEEPSALEAWEKMSAREQQAHVSDLDAAPDPLARERCVRELVNELAVQIVRPGER